jgi:hypothetical protein
MTDNNQSDWELASWDTSQGPFPSQSQSDPADQPSFQQPPTQAPTWNDFGDLLNQFNTLSTNVQETQCTSLQTARVISDLVARVAAIPVVQQPPPSTTIPSVQHSVHAPEGQANPRTTARFREPKPFKGKADDVPGFILEINDAIALSRNALPTDQDKCIYMASFFEEGAAKQWYISICISQTHLLDSFEDFRNEFQAHFGNPNVATSAKYKIDALSQTGSVASYAARYFELLVHVDWSEQTKIDTFYRKLKPTVKDIISYTPVDKRPKTFKKYVDFCIDIDNRVHEREVERRHEAKPTNTVKSSNPSRNTNNSSFSPCVPPTSSSSSSTLPPGEPMEIDATKTGKPRGPLTPEERQHRKDLKLCLYCGGPNHDAKSCPNMLEAAKKRFASKQANPSGKA